VTKEGAVVSTLADGRQEDDDENDDVETGFTDGSLANARFNRPQNVVVVSNDDIFVADSENHTIRVINRRTSSARFTGTGRQNLQTSRGRTRVQLAKRLALDTEENLLVADSGNHAIRRVTMEGTVITVADTGEKRV
jgi:hypothetical protein